MKKSITRRRFRRYLPIYLLALPGLLYLFVNNYIPMGGIIIAFKNYRYNTGIWGSPWAGLRNFTFLFHTNDVLLITRNTLLYNLVFIVLGTALAITLAILLDSIVSRVLRKAFQTIVLLPYLLSMVFISYLAYGFLSSSQGFMNKTVLAALGMHAVDWYMAPQYWPFILVFIEMWYISGYYCIIYLSTLMGIDRTYYEAASIDGASEWQKVRFITLPFLKNTVVIMSLLALGRIFYSDFGLFYQVPMNSGALYDVTSTIDTYVFRGLMQSPNIAMSSAAGVYQSLVGFILVLAANLVVGKVSKENALF